MKKILFICLLVICYTSLFSQDSAYVGQTAYKSVSGYTKPESDNENLIWFEIRGTSKRGVIKEKLKTAKTLEEISPGYPANWLKDYISTEISVNTNGQLKAATGSDKQLNQEQISLLGSADLGSEIIIKVKYKYPNATVNKTDVHTMTYEVTIVPDHEAAFVGGNAEMDKYFRTKVVGEIVKSGRTDNSNALITFTVNENGEVINPKINKSTKDSKIDALILDAVRNMPKWKPAESSSGEKMKQNFEFAMGKGGC